MQEAITLVYDKSEPERWFFIMEDAMINFEEELKHFQPSGEIEDAESEIYEHDITDMTDIMQQMMSELKRK